MNLKKVVVNESFQIEKFDNVNFVVNKKMYDDSDDSDYYVLTVYPENEKDVKVQWDYIPYPLKNGKNNLEKYFAEAVEDIIEKKIDEYGVAKIKEMIKSAFKTARTLNFLDSAETKQKFKKIFGFVMPIQPILKVANIPYFDVIKFDKLIGTPDGTSTKDYITTKYSKDVCEFVESLI